jgi:hypothetical protein
MALDAGNSAFPVVASQLGALGSHSEASKRSEAPSAPLILVCSCGTAQIPAPIGSTENTRYTCRRCCALIVRRRNMESLLAFRHGRARPPAGSEDFEIAKSEE